MQTTEKQHLFTYRIDADNKISFVGTEWLAFARENDAEHLTRETVVGQSLFRFIADQETRYLYELIIAKVRRVGRTIVLPFRCDGPCVRRFMELTISLWTDEQIQFEGRLLREEQRDAVALFDPTTGRSDAYLTVCGWCKRLDVSGDWLEAESALQRLPLFNLAQMPKLTHGICDRCSDWLTREFTAFVSYKIIRYGTVSAALV
jgi:hypothetical protein